MKMNPEVKTKWVAALRSGDYEQGRTYLNNNGKFCCLGVLSEIAVAEGIVDTREIYGIVSYGLNGSARGDGGWESAGVTKPIREWANIESNPRMGNNDAMSMNDSFGYTFDQIADEIEEHL